MEASSRNELSAALRAEIDRWVARFPDGRQRSAVIAALHAAQHENHGYLTRELMEGVAAYLGMPVIQVFEVATFYSMFETKPVGRHSSSFVVATLCRVPHYSPSSSPHVKQRPAPNLAASGAANFPSQKSHVFNIASKSSLQIRQCIAFLVLS